MLELDKVSAAQFSACLDQDFEIAIKDAPPLRLKLKELRPLGRARPGAKRDPFALTFAGDANLRLPQGIYRVHNAALGDMDIFIVQIAGGPTGSAFEAIFN